MSEHGGCGFTSPLCVEPTLNPFTTIPRDSRKEEQKCGFNDCAAKDAARIA